MKASTETDLVRACLDLLRLRGVLAWRHQNMGTWDPVRKVRRTFHGLKGVADILAIHPRRGCDLGSAGRLIAIEVKTASGRLSFAQQAFLDAVTENGGMALVIRDVSELASCLDDLGL